MSETIKTSIDLRKDRREELEELQKQLGHAYLKDTINYVIDLGLGKALSLSQELIKKLDKIFIDKSPIEKLNIVVDNFLKWHEKFPYLTVQKIITPEDAGFPQCPLIYPLYYGEEFLGFHCLAKRPPLNLPRIKVGKLTLNYTTSDICWRCVELCKKQKLGIDLFHDITLDQIKLHKEEEKKLSKTEQQKILAQKLEEKGYRKSTIEKAMGIFKFVHYDKATDSYSWETGAISKASKHLGLSRPTIYDILKELAHKE